MAEVWIRTKAGISNVALVARSEEASVSDRVARDNAGKVTEHLDPSGARRLAVQLMAAAGRAERADARSEWP
jgi:hypothetical protein